MTVPKIFAASAALVSPAFGQVIMPSFVANYEAGLNVPAGFDDSSFALADDGNVVSLGQWSDDPTTGDGDPVGLVLGFDTPLANVPGAFLEVGGNAFSFGDQTFREPAFVEVAVESSGVASVDGWRDETFFLLAADNYGALAADPRVAPASLGFQYPTEPWYGNPIWSGDVSGYADSTVGGDRMFLDRAIDLAGNGVSLSQGVSYVRLRTVSDDDLGVFGPVSAEIDFVRFVVPEPAAVSIVAAVGGLLLRRRR